MRKKMPLSMEILHASAGGNGRRGEVKVTYVDEESEAGNWNLSANKPPIGGLYDRISTAPTGNSR